MDSKRRRSHSSSPSPSRKRRKRSSSRSKTKKSSKRKKKYESSSESDGSSDSSLNETNKYSKQSKHLKKKRRDSSSDSSMERRKRKKEKKKKRKKEKKKKKKKRKKDDLKKKDVDKKVHVTVVSNTKKEKPNIKDDIGPVPARHSMKPMTKEEWEKQQSVIRRVYDPTSGRDRLVKGDGEILEEIVSKERQKDINKQATVGDGVFYQSQVGLLK